ncbi:double zinc ribbon domain-containing protein, partial [Enterobacter cloacae]|nr:zinc-ribbon domain-containing protein [Enterobacter cloacae]
GGYGSGGPPAGGWGNGGLACPNCKASNAPGARFCQQCGTSLVPSACAQCGTTLQPGAKFCAQCGKAAV